jgi:cell division protein FtsX
MAELGWSPDAEAVKASEEASEKADAIEDASLNRLRASADTTETDTETAKQTRAAKPDLRLEASEAEQQHANQVTDMVTWVLLGISSLIVLGGVVLSVLFGASII